MKFSMEVLGPIKQVRPFFLTIEASKFDRKAIQHLRQTSTL